MAAIMPGNLPVGATGFARFFADDGTNASTGATGTQTQLDTAYAAWILLHPAPPIVLPVTLLQLPTSNPGITGAVHVINNTLYISQGPSVAAVQIGTTGPIGSTGAAVL